MPALTVENIQMRFGGLRALDDVSLNVDEGRVVGLIGPNGSGKTTLLNVVAGVLRPSSGRVTLDGRRIDGLRPDRIVKLGVVKTHQIPKPFPAMTARENVAVAAMYGGGMGSLDEALAEADRLLARMGMGSRGNSLAGQLTVQEKKRLELARALGTGAKVILLDEVFAGLSPQELSNSIELFRDVQKELGFTALVVEHVMKAVLTLAERIIVLVEGKKIAEGAPNDVVANKDVIQAYLGGEAR